MKELKATPVETASPEISLDSKEFYDLMQVYRHWPITDQPGTCARFEAVKEWVKIWAESQLTQVREELRDCKLAYGKLFNENAALQGRLDEAE